MPYTHDPVLSSGDSAWRIPSSLLERGRNRSLGKRDNVLQVKRPLFLLSLAPHPLFFPLRQAAGRRPSVSQLNPRGPGASGRAHTLLPDTRTVESSTSTFPKRLGEGVRGWGVMKSPAGRRESSSRLLTDVISSGASTPGIPMI